MNKKYIVLLCAVFCSTLCCAAFKQILPSPKGQGPDILLINGGRPWVGEETANIFIRNGYRVTLLDSIHLAGLGGAPIRFFLTDKEEPQPFDGITPAFKNLNRYNLVVINAVKTENQRKLFTAERISALKKFVSDGGALLLNIDSPFLDGLSPVIPGRIYEGATTALRPQGKRFDFLPETWLNTAKCRLVTLQKDAKGSGSYVDNQGKTVAPLFVAGKYGKGKVIFWNATFERSGGVRQMFNWAYSPALFLAMAAESGNFDIPGERAIYKLPAVPAPEKIKQLALDVKPPEFGLNESKAVPRIKKTSNGAYWVYFKSGLTMLARPDNWINISGGKKMLTKRLLPLDAAFSRDGVALDINTSEAEGSGAKQRIHKLNYKLTGVNVSAGMAELEYRLADGTRLFRSFKEGNVVIDGKKYAGFAEKVRIENSGNTWESIATSSLSDTADGLKGLCFSCYTAPRGWKVMDYSGKKTQTLETWTFFANGQPFVYMGGPDGVSLNFISEVQPFFVRQVVTKSHPQYVATQYRWQFGRRKAPLASAWYWHVATDEKSNDNNAYIGVWQFVRHILRKAAGLKEIPASPMALYQNTCTPKEIEAAVIAAKKLGFRQISLPLGPIGMENLPQKAALFDVVKKHGLISRPWTPGDYTHGKSEKIMKNTDWFLLDHNQKIVQYFGKHPVIDTNNQAFRSWYKKLMTGLISSGVGGVYLDMGGTTSINVSYRGDEALNGLDGALDLYRFFHGKNIPVGVEGMNPLVLDNYWYRQRFYQPVSGKEFMLIGAQLGTHLCGDDLAVDYFRAAMYGCMMMINVDGYALGFERTPGEIKLVERIGKLNPSIQLALDTVGMPFIREIPAGTLWLSQKGAAVFCRNSVEKLDLKLPAGWKVIHGNTQNIPSDSIIVIKNTAETVDK